MNPTSHFQVNPVIPHSGTRRPQEGRRGGFSLAEVLIAIFVLAIGMMGILALFPLGASQMAQAIKDERSAQLADLGEARMRILWRMAWLNSSGGLNTPAQVVGSPASPGIPAVTGVATEYGYIIRPINNLPATPSQPMYLDPIGYNTVPTGGTQTAVAGLTALPRATSSALALQTPQYIIPMFGLIDDISFNPNGMAANPPTDTLVNRADRYNCAFLLQLPRANVPQEVNLKVVVYAGRPPWDNKGVETALSPAITVDPVNYPNSMTIPGSGLPHLRVGTWVLLVGATSTTTESFADFYRVVGFANASGGQYVLSVSPPIRSHAGNTAYSGTAVILDNVVEVFDRGTITPLEVAAH